jgi:Transcriptional antiterminator
MMLLDSRCLQIIKLLLSSELVPIETIVTEVNVSSKTIKKDIRKVTDYVKNAGGDIQFIKGKGYQLLFNDEETREIFITGKVNPSMSVENYNPGKTQNRKMIVVMLLLSTDYTSFDDIADALFISRSSINQISKRIHNTIEAYYLKLQYKPHYGLKVIGEESMIRYAICDNHEFFSSDSNSSVLLDRISSEYTKVFATYKDQLLLEFERLLSEQQLSVYSSLKLKLIYLIVVIQVRRSQGFFIENNLRLAFLESTIFYEISRQLLYILGVTEHQEILWFSVFIFANSEGKKLEELKETEKYISQADQYQKEINTFLNKKGLLQIQNDHEQKRYLELLINVIVKSDFSIRDRFISINVFHHCKNNTFAYYIALEVGMRLMKTRALKPSHDAYFTLTHYIQHLISYDEYEYKPITIALLIPYYLITGEKIKERILEQKRSLIERIDLINQLHVSESYVSEYDLVIELVFDSLIPENIANHLHIDANPSTMEYFQVLKEIDYHAYRIYDLLNSINFKTIAYAGAKTKQDVFNLFCLFRGLNLEESIEEINHMSERENLTSYENKISNTILFIAFTDIPQKDRVHILKQEKPFTWKSRKIKYFIFFSIYSKQANNRIKLAKTIADTFIFQTDLLELFHDLISDQHQEQAVQLLVKRSQYLGFE